VTIDCGFWISGELTAHDNDIAVDFGFRPELDVTQNGDNITLHFGVYINTTHHGNGRVAHSPACYARAPEDGDDSIVDIASARGGPEYGHDGISVLARGQLRLAPDRHHIVAVSVRVPMPLVLVVRGLGIFV
jgi:hypothetical protein